MRCWSSSACVIGRGATSLCHPGNRRREVLGGDRDPKHGAVGRRIGGNLSSQRLDLGIEPPLREPGAVAKDEVLHEVREFLATDRVQQGDLRRR